MRRMKSVFAVVLTLCLLTAVGALPWLIAHVQELRDTGEVGYANINEVTLTIRNQDLWDTMVIAGRSDLESYAVAMDACRRTEEEVTAAAGNLCQRLRTAGLVQLSEFPEMTTEAMVVYPTSQPDSNRLMWGVYCVSGEPNKTGNFPELWVIVDDATGKVLGFEYSDNGAPYLGADMESLLRQCYGLYFELLGEPFSQMYESAMIESRFPPKDNYAHVVFQFRDLQRDPVTVVVSADGFGLSVSFGN